MFNPGLYNQQRSTYVGSTLGEFMNLLPYAQQRYDSARDMLDDTDVFINSIEHLEGDRDSLYQITSPFRESIASARDSGDYRGLYDDIRRTSKKVIGDKGLKTISDSYQGALKQKELEATYGTQALSFSDPSKHRSIEVDENGNTRYNVYVPHVEKRGDYDKRIQDIWSVLKADGMPIDLQEHKGAIDGFLKYGSWKGISDSKISGYLKSAFERYVDSPEGEQDYRRLTQIEGFAPDEARADIERRMLAVGSGMKYSDVDYRYMQDPSLEAKAATSVFSNMFGQQGASDSNTLKVGQLFGGNKLEVSPDGKLVNSFDFGKEWGTRFAAGSGANGTAQGWLGNFAQSTLSTVWQGLFGKNTELKLNNNQQVAMDNMKLIAAAQMGVDPSNLSNQDLANYVNMHFDDDLAVHPPTDILSKKELDLVNEVFGETVKLDNGNVTIPKAITGNNLYWKGRKVTYNELFGKDSGITPANISTTRRIGKNNPYGFPNGGYILEILDKDGEIYEVPMEINPTKQGDAVLENALYQLGYNKMTYSSLQPFEVAGMKYSASANPITGDYTIKPENGEPIVISGNSDLYDILKNHPDYEGMSRDQFILESSKVPTENLLSKAFVLKIYERHAR